MVFSMRLKELIERANELIAKEETFCLATVVLSHIPDVPAGLKLIILSNGTLKEGTGLAQIDSSLRSVALSALRDKKRGIVEIDKKIRIFLDIVSGESKLFVCGAGHIAIPLASFARKVGFKVTVLDDRSDFADPSRFPGCEVIVQDFVAALRKMCFGPSAFIVVITRGHEHDAECLAEVLRKETAYVGLIGSRRRVHFVLEMLRQGGIPPERLQDVFTPIGLPIGAESPEEIALSIASELVCIRRRGPMHARSLRTDARATK